MSSPEAGLTPTILAGTGFWEEPTIIEALITKRLTSPKTTCIATLRRGSGRSSNRGGEDFGVAKRHAYRCLSEYSFRRRHREESRQKRLRRMVALLNPSTGGSRDYGRKQGGQILHRPLLGTAAFYTRARRDYRFSVLSRSTHETQVALAMSRRRTHVRAGVLAAAAGLVCIGLAARWNASIPVLAGAIRTYHLFAGDVVALGAKWCGARIPDLIEPAHSPRHRGFWHSKLVAGVLFIGAVLLAGGYALGGSIPMAFFSVPLSTINWT